MNKQSMTTTNNEEATKLPCLDRLVSDFADALDLRAGMVETHMPSFTLESQATARSIMELTASELRKLVALSANAPAMPTASDGRPIT